jgi:hypothetical protein
MELKIFKGTPLRFYDMMGQEILFRDIVLVDAVINQYLVCKISDNKFTSFFQNIYYMKN